MSLCLLVLFASCGPRCNLRLCADILVVEVRSPDGGLADDFRGSVTIDGQESTFECPSTGRPSRECLDAGVIELNLSWIDRTETSRPIGLRGTALPARVTALDGGLSWSGTITPAIPVENGDACGPPCRPHVERVVLESK